MEVKAVLFDLDGVITDTAKYHFDAWKKVASFIGIDLDNSFEEKLKGVSREESLSLILEYGKKKLDKEEVEEMLKVKNDMYLSSLKNLNSSDILEGIEELFEKLCFNKIKIVIASGSKNAPYIIDKLKLNSYIDGIVDASSLKSKPAPDIFLEAVNLSGVNKENCVAIEDAQSGIIAINKANIFSIAIGNLKEADLKLNNTKELTYDIITKL